MRCRKCGRRIFDGATHVCDQRSTAQWIKDRRDYWGSAADAGVGGTRSMAERMAERLSRALEEV